MAQYISGDNDEKDVKWDIDDMTLEDKVAQMFMVRPEQLVNSEYVTAAGKATQEALKRCHVGGLIYFKSNICGFR